MGMEEKLQEIPRKNLPTKSSLLLGFKSAGSVYWRKNYKTFYSNVFFFLIWKYQEEIYLTLPQRLVIKKCF